MKFERFSDAFRGYIKSQWHEMVLFVFFFVTLFIVDYMCTLCHPIHTSIYYGVI